MKLAYARGNGGQSATLALEDTRMLVIAAAHVRC